jgi:glycosyltransferase involved in cell wall biosynthesis
MPLFSIVIPAYNRGSYIRATLDSVRAQEFTDYEVIAVDDGSTDETLSIIREHAWVRVLQQDNKGPGAARNYGVSQTSGLYIAFLDSDDLWFPWTLKTFSKAIANQNYPDLVAGKLLKFHDDYELQQIQNEPFKIDVFEDYYAASKERYFVGACIMVVRRAKFLEVGGFRNQPVYAEDCDLALRLGLVRGFVQVLSPTTLGYRQHATNARRDYARIYLGTAQLVESERGGKYPGGEVRKSDRLRLVTLHTRPFSLACAKHGHHRYGWTLYWKTFLWHLRMFRWKYLIGFPLVAIWHAIRRHNEERVPRVAEQLL